MDTLFSSPLDIFSILIAIVIPIIIYALNMRRKSLTYESLPTNIEQHNQYWRYKFTNTGNLPINPEDYEEPITLTFAKSTQVLSAEISKQSSKLKGMNATIQEGPFPSIVLSKGLLNPKDWFILKVLARGIRRYSFRGRIKDIHKITLYAMDEYRKFVEPVLKVSYIIWVVGNGAIFLLPTLSSTKFVSLLVLNALSFVVVENSKGWYWRTNKIWSTALSDFKHDQTS
jgi:hypothetical protein